MKILCLLTLYFLQESVSLSIYNNLAKFCNSNGFQYITLFGPAKKSNIDDAFDNLQKHLVRSRKISFDDLEGVVEFNLDTLIAIVDSEAFLNEDNVGDLRSVLDQLGKHKIKKGILVFTESLDSDQENILKSNLEKNLLGDAFFYLLYLMNNNVTLYKQVISLINNTKPIIQDLEFNTNGQIIEKYDLEGAQLYSIALSWAPYFTIENCDDTGRNCDVSGFLSDYLDALGNIMNFTWTSHAPPSGSWGVRPLSGPFNKSGLWGGVMGGVVNTEYHMSLSQWVWNIDRYGLLDFVSTTANKVCLALTPQPPAVDTGLFIRPFTDDAWGGIGFVFMIILIVLLVPYSTISYYEHTEGYNITAFFGWMFFVLINAFYGGALTMFFTSELTIPFNSIEDVMKVYPDWKLKMMVGNDVHFQYKAIQGDKLYAEFWDRVINLPDETVFNTLQEGLDILLEERAVIHTMTGMLKGYFQANPFRQQSLKVFAYGRAEYYAIIVPTNSPLKPILQMGSSALVEAGTSDYLIKAWEGKGIPQGSLVEVMILTPGQVILIFIVIIFTFSISICVFCFEVGHQKLKDRQEELNDPYYYKAENDKVNKAKVRFLEQIKRFDEKSKIFN